eukprot:TRINITY_DN12520_c0_g1_i2.p3 TRINITY_DN12520_c0_g1~~TRINITY_DN12520_c0_g1_i2.p3  ORF type:complete len:117 (-),score=4.30 TRINITY_DN12520_c0_g1_i2:152-502(-)
MGELNQGVAPFSQNFMQPLCKFRQFQNHHKYSSGKNIGNVSIPTSGVARPRDRPRLKIFTRVYIQILLIQNLPPIFLKQVQNLQKFLYAMLAHPKNEFKKKKKKKKKQLFSLFLFN